MTHTNHRPDLSEALESLRIDLLIEVRSAEADARLLDRARTLLGRGDFVGAYCAMSTGPRVREEMRAEWGAELADRWVALETELEALGDESEAEPPDWDGLLDKIDEAIGALRVSLAGERRELGKAVAK